MYGSQFHFETSQFSKSSINTHKIDLPKIKLKNIALISVLILTTKISFAGGKSPKLAGGNGNAVGKAN